MTFIATFSRSAKFEESKILFYNSMFIKHTYFKNRNRNEHFDIYLITMVVVVIE